MISDSYYLDELLMMMEIEPCLTMQPLVMMESLRSS